MADPPAYAEPKSELVGPPLASTMPYSTPLRLKVFTGKGVSVPRGPLTSDS